VPKVAGGVCAGGRRLGTNGHTTLALSALAEDELVEDVRMAEPKPRRSGNKV